MLVSCLSTPIADKGRIPATVSLSAEALVGLAAWLPVFHKLCKSRVSVGPLLLLGLVTIGCWIQRSPGEK